MSVAPLAVLGVLWVLSEGARPYALVALAVLYAVSLTVELPLLNRLRVRNTSYSVEPGYVYITRGALINHSVLIALHQILSVETVQGPLLERFGFAKVRFRCLTDVEWLGPLDADAVIEVRRAIAQQRRSGDNVGE